MINNSVYEFRYLYLILTIVFLFLTPLAASINFIVIASSFVCIILMLTTNKLINPESYGMVGIFHMVLIILVIGGYDFFSRHAGRLEFFMNAGGGAGGGAFIYGMFVHNFRKDD